MIENQQVLSGLQTMGVTAKSLGIDKLDVSDRLALMGELWDSVAAETEKLPLSVELIAELDRRIEDADANRDSGVPWGASRIRRISPLEKVNYSVQFRAAALVEFNESADWYEARQLGLNTR